MRVSFKNGFYWSFRIGNNNVCFRGTDCRIDCGEWLEKVAKRNTIDLYFNPIAWLPDNIYYRLLNCVKALRMIAHGEKIKKAFRAVWDIDSYFFGLIFLRRLKMHLYRIEHSGNYSDFADCFTNVIANSEKEAVKNFKKISDRIIFNCYLIF